MIEELGPREQSRALRNSRLTRLGAGVATLCACTGAGGWMIGTLMRTQSGRNQVVIGICVAGLVLVACQLGAYGRAPTADQVLRFFRNPHFWGVEFICASVTIYLILPLMWPLQPSVAEVKVHARPKVEAPMVSNVVEAAESAPEFPALEVTGLVVNGARSSAMINGRVVMLGESIDGVELAKVAENGIVGKKSGFTHGYRMTHGKSGKR